MEAFVTLATTDDYALGALVWAQSLRQVGTTKKLVIMIGRNVSLKMRRSLDFTFDDVVLVDVLDSRDTANLRLLNRPDLGVTFTKLHCWKLTHFHKAVFMDADTLVLSNIDDLFSREELSASPDPGWPDCFNSGVFVFQPSMETYDKLITFALTHGSFDGGDQGLLNQYFSDWSTKDISRHLPFAYNCMSQAFYSYLPAMKHFNRGIKVVHFIGSTKPWHHSVNTETGRVEPKEGSCFQTEYLEHWWDVFFSKVQLSLDSEMEGLSGHLARLSISSSAALAASRKTGFSVASMSERDRQYMWERGEVDYTGEDRFDNILAKIASSIASPDVYKGGSSSGRP